MARIQNFVQVFAWSDMDICIMKYFSGRWKNLRYDGKCERLKLPSNSIVRPFFLQRFIFKRKNRTQNLQAQHTTSLSYENLIKFIHERTRSNSSSHCLLLIIPYMWLQSDSSNRFPPGFLDILWASSTPNEHQNQTTIIQGSQSLKTAFFQSFHILFAACYSVNLYALL